MVPTNLGLYQPLQRSKIANTILSIFFLDKGCKRARFYGSNCDIPCPVNCKDSTCNIQSGTCFTCKPGWIGHYCDSSKIKNVIQKRVKYTCFFNL